MKLRQLFENIYEEQPGEFDGGLKTIGVCFGRFNPPHRGHKAVWQAAATNPIWYVGTNQSTSGPKDPLPYDVKLQCMQAVWPKVAGHVIPEQSLLTLAAKIYAEHGDNVHLKVYTDEEWLVKTLTQYNGVEKEHGMYRFQQIDHVKTQRLASATNLRAAVRAGDRSAFYKDMGIKPSVTVEFDGREYPVFDVVAHFLNKYPEKVKKAVAEDCWKGYKQIGMKKKGNRQVPNCVPNESHVDEGDVVQFPKKHKGDLDNTHDCPKCGGDLQGGKYMGHQVKVCMPCKQVYLPPNSGIDKHGNKVVDEIAGAFPSPSTKAKWAADAAASNAAEAKRQELLKAQQLQKNTAEVERQQKINHHALDAEIPVKEVGSDPRMRMHMIKKLIKAHGWELSDLELATDAEIQHEYNKLPEIQALHKKLNISEIALPKAMCEATQAHISKRKQQSTAGLNTFGDGEHVSGDYTMYRLGMAVAGANGKDPVDMKAKSWIGKKKSTHPYTQEEQDMLKQAYDVVGAEYQDVNKGDMKSRELDDTHRVSPVASRKKNKYGV